jgi:hypothetical protein
MPAWGAAVFEDTYPVRWLGRQAVVTLPEHIDMSNAGEIREELLSVINRGAAAQRLDDVTRGIRGGASAAGGQDPPPHRPPPPGAP